jgi:hypothetical protein
MRRNQAKPESSKYYDKPETSYQRILDSADVTQEAKQKPQGTYEKPNPFMLSNA